LKGFEVDGIQRELFVPGLTIYTSNRLEVLAEALSDVLRQPLDSVLAQEVVMVQSRGMERWLRMRLAAAHGISANIWFPFPNRFLQKIVARIFPDRSQTEFFSPDVAAWRIMDLLPECIEDRDFTSLRDYLNIGDGDLKRFQLSALISDTFDQYLLFRPEMVLRWERGEETHWQARLWRRLASGHEMDHRAAIARDFLSMIERDDVPSGVFPSRLSVFGISALPRFHMELLAGIGRVTEVNLFLMNPCMEYWGDLVSEKTRLGGARRVAETGVAETELYVETGNPLLSSLGVLGRDFFDLTGEFPHTSREFFQEPGSDSLLHCIQSDILHMFNRKERETRKFIASPGRSVQIHACHSPMREVEVLHDALLDLMDRDKNLACEEIVVMTPEIEVYAPFIRSVFQKSHGGSDSIPFSIADRSSRSESPVVDTFFRILELCGGRYSSSEVAAVLEADPVGARFEIQGERLSTVKRWIKDVRICWGVDGPGKAEAGLPAFEENTWSAGVSRLLLGYAAPGRGEKTFAGTSPYDDIEGNDAEVLGGLCTFLKRLFEFTRSFRAPRTPVQWASDLESLLQHLFSDADGFAADLGILRRAFQDMTEAAVSAGFSGAVDLATITWLLARRLEKTEYGSGFISRGVTFCAMLPMRSIPFKVVCLLGLNSDAYPRRSSQAGFDLIARRPRRGDRSRRADDRYLFLEALLSARDVFYVSYVGRSIRDNSTMPPSVVVSELMDYISEGFKGDTDIREQLVVTHPLQPFSPDYFRPGSRLFSYSPESFDAARALSGPRETPEPFISEEIPPAETGLNEVTIEDLCSFFSHPARYLLKRRLGVSLDDRAFVLDEREPFFLGGLERYELENRILSWLLEGRDPSVLMDLVRSEGILPHGNVGRRFFETTVSQVRDFVRRLRRLTREPEMPPVEVSLKVSGVSLSGFIGSVNRDGMVVYRYARLKTGDLIKTWIKHLALCLASPSGVRKRSVFAGLSGQGKAGRSWAARSFEETPDAKDALGALLKLYRQGLGGPLPFSPDVSWVYISARAKGEPEESAIQRARGAWEGSAMSRGAREDPYNELCFKESGLLDLPGFKDAAIGILAPLLSGMEELK
jgi:exodeoxyribonuclease V gamma subunit